MPVSATMNRRHTLSSTSDLRSTRTNISPRSVNLRALPTKFTRICRIRPGSPATQTGTSGLISHMSSSFFSCARKAKPFMVSVTLS